MQVKGGMNMDMGMRDQYKTIIGQKRARYAVVYEAIAVSVDVVITPNTQFDNTNVRAISITGNYMQFPIDDWIALPESKIS